MRACRGEHPVRSVETHGLVPGIREVTAQITCPTGQVEHARTACCGCGRMDNIVFYDSTRLGVHTENPGLPIRPFDNLMADLRVFRCLLRVILGVGRDPIATAAIREPAGIDHRDW